MTESIVELSQQIRELDEEIHQAIASNDTHRILKLKEENRVLHEKLREYYRDIKRKEEKLCPKGGCAMNISISHYGRITLFVMGCLSYYGSVYDKKYKKEGDGSEMSNGEKMARLLCNNPCLEYIVDAYNYLSDIRPTLTLEQKEDMDKFVYSVILKNEGRI